MASNLPVKFQSDSVLIWPKELSRSACLIFPRELIIKDKNRAILEAKAGGNNLKLWCDGSKLENGVPKPLFYEKQRVERKNGMSKK